MEVHDELLDEMRREVALLEDDLTSLRSGASTSLTLNGVVVSVVFSSLALTRRPVTGIDQFVTILALSCAGLAVLICLFVLAPASLDRSESISPEDDGTGESVLSLSRGELRHRLVGTYAERYENLEAATSWRARALFVGVVLSGAAVVLVGIAAVGRIAC